MKPFEWNSDKNLWIKTLRGLNFEDVVKAINQDRLLDTIPHSNQKKYPGQKMYIIQINNYCCVVPFIETKEKIFLKTIYPSRLATKKYLKKGK